MFYTLERRLISVTFYGLNFLQSPTSSTKEEKILCACFWSIVVRNAQDHYHIPKMTDVQIVLIPKMNVRTFVTTDDETFHHIGSIP